MSWLPNIHIEYSDEEVEFLSQTGTQTITMSQSIFSPVKTDPFMVIYNEDNLPDDLEPSLKKFRGMEDFIALNVPSLYTPPPIVCMVTSAEQEVKQEPVLEQDSQREHRAVQRKHHVVQQERHVVKQEPKRQLDVEPEAEPAPEQLPDECADDTDDDNDAAPPPRQVTPVKEDEAAALLKMKNSYGPDHKFIILQEPSLDDVLYDGSKKAGYSEIIISGNVPTTDRIRLYLRYISGEVVDTPMLSVLIPRDKLKKQRGRSSPFKFSEPATGIYVTPDESGQFEFKFVVMKVTGKEGVLFCISSDDDYTLGEYRSGPHRVISYRKNVIYPKVNVKKFK